MIGTMSFTSESTSWDVNLSSNHSQILNSGFIGDITSSNTSVNSDSFQGQFYGEDKLISVGGTFEIEDDLTNEAFRNDIETKNKNYS